MKVHGKIAVLASIVSFFIVQCALASDRIVVMISVDGLAHYYIDDPKADMPNLRALAKDGARADAMMAVSPTVTWPNHTTLVTGDYPARHGVVGNNYFDRATNKSVILISDPVYDKEQIVKVPTIYDVAKDAGLKTLGIRWPATRNAKKLDWQMPDSQSIVMLNQYATPELISDCKAAGFELIPAGGEGKNPDTIEQSAEHDDGYVKAFVLMLQKHRPNLAVLHVANVDHQEHLHGPKSDEAYAAVKSADAEVGMVWDELKKDFGGKATLIVVSDHGFSPIQHAIFPNVILREAGLVDVKGVRVVQGSVRLIPQGGAGMIYITDESKHDEIAKKVTAAFSNVEGVEKVVNTDELKDYGVANPKDDPHAPDMLIFAKEGYIVGDTAAGALPFAEKPEKSGSHGHDPNLPDLHATFVAWGDGIKTGANLGQIKNIDVAPTIAKLLQIDLANTDGKPLDAALAN